MAVSQKLMNKLWTTSSTLFFRASEWKDTNSNEMETLGHTVIRRTSRENARKLAVEIVTSSTVKWPVKTSCPFKSPRPDGIYPVNGETTLQGTVASRCPQGGVLSPLLCNLVVDKILEEIKK